MVYPQFRIAINIREGDFMLQNPHEYHGNTSIQPITKDYTRLSMIFYYRKNISKC